MRWGLWSRRTGRRIRRRLGFPSFGRRTWLLVVLGFLGLLYVGTAVIADFLVRLGQYWPQYYEPRDFEREELLKEKMEKKTP